MATWLSIISFFYIGLVNGNDFDLDGLSCKNKPLKDPCLPGGKWDPLFKKCTGVLANECFGCYEGAYCKRLNKNCTLISEGGEPSVFQQYWESVQGEPCTQLTSDYRTTYQMEEELQPIRPLKESILKLHKQVGNVAVDDGYSMVIGYGATYLLNAVLYAMAKKSSSQTTNVRAQVPVYPMYASHVQTTVAIGSKTQSPNLLKYLPDDFNNLSDEDIEIVTYPNNPDGTLREPQIKNTANVVYDLAYYWPNFCNASSLKPLSKNIMIFTASKLTGHAGTRFGWALVKDKELYQAMLEYNNLKSLGVGIDVQIRMLQVIKHMTLPKTPPAKASLLVSRNNKDCSFPSDFFCYAHKTMRDRFDRLRSIFRRANSKLFTFANQKTRGAYAWIKCPPGYDCLNTFKHVGISGAGGHSYLDSPEYIRLTLMMRDSEIDDLLERIERLLKTFHALPSHVPFYSVQKDSTEKKLVNVISHSHHIHMNMS